MKHAFIGLFLLLSVLPLRASPLRVGDVLLQPLHCWLCSLIESEEGSIYSHMGVVVSSEPLLVAEAFGKVRAVPLNEFSAKTQKGQAIKVIRFKDPYLLLVLQKDAAELLNVYQKDFDGRLYDGDFLWNNVDENGLEKIYCSELVTKLFQKILGVSVPLKKMTFAKNLELWDRHFKGKTPVGEWGNSPGDFERSALFEPVGEL